MRKKTSKYRGVSWLENAKKWAAEIQVHRTKYYLGIFTTEELAFKAYQKKFKELCGRTYEHLEPIFDHKENTVKIPLNTKSVSNHGYWWATVDIEDFEKVKDYSWSYGEGYARSHTGSKHIKLHSFILNASMIDHINGDKLG